MLYNYMQHVQSSLDEELDFCTHRSNGLWDQYRNIAGEAVTREKREMVHRAAGFARHGSMHNRRQAGYGGESAPGTTPSSTAASTGGQTSVAPSQGSNGGSYGGSSQGAVGGGSSQGGNCACTAGPQGPPVSIF